MVKTRLRWLLRVKAFLVSLRLSSVPSRRSYSQHGEDVIVSNIRHKQGRSSTGFYIDIGANEPCRLSNTYLFYRQGWRGILVDPDVFNCLLLRLFRPRDLVLCAAAASAPGVLRFFEAAASVNSSVVAQASTTARRSSLAAAIQLDDLLPFVEGTEIELLSIDAEGFEVPILKGAEKLLGHCRIVCVEDNAQREAIEALLVSKGFALIQRAGCNLLYGREDDLLSRLNS